MSTTKRAHAACVDINNGTLIILCNTKSRGSRVLELVNLATYKVSKIPGPFHVSSLPPSGCAYGLWVLKPHGSKMATAIPVSHSDKTEGQDVTLYLLRTGKAFPEAHSRSITSHWPKPCHMPSLNQSLEEEWNH